VKIPKGTYTLGLSAKTTPGLDQARVLVTDARGRTARVDLTGAGTAWTTVAKKHLNLASGTATVSVEAASAGTGTLSIDALSLKQD
jgi:hypothetical protein